MVFQELVQSTDLNNPCCKFSCDATLRQLLITGKFTAGNNPAALECAFNTYSLPYHRIAFWTA
jgi:hypothetical protein